MAHDGKTEKERFGVCSGAKSEISLGRKGVRAGHRHGGPYGFYNRLAQKLFHTPPYSDIDLDTFGSFVWKQIDGGRTVYDIAMLVKAEFGQKAEPLYPRLVTYFRTLRNNRFVQWRSQKSGRQAG